MRMHYYHNSKCSKSRAALDLLKERGLEPQIHIYLEEPLTKDEILDLLEKLQISANDLVRKGESEYTSLELENASTERLVDAMASHPNLIERPIFVYGSKAVIGRPPEKVLEIVDSSNL